MANQTQEMRSIPELIRELREESAVLVRQEVELAKTELGEKASTFGRNAAYLAIGGAVAYAGLIFLLFAVMRLITVGLQSAGVAAATAVWLSPLILGLIVALIGGALIMKSWRTFSHESIVPEKTIQSLKEDTSWTRTKLKEA
jgi:uncharacterized integral membrane protein